MDIILSMNSDIIVKIKIFTVFLEHLNTKKFKGLSEKLENQNKKESLT